MMKITALIEKNSRVQVFIDEKYSFSCSVNLVLENQLHVGFEISEEKRESLKKQAYESILKQKLIEYMMSGYYSRKELFRKINTYSKRRYNLESSEEVFKKKFEEIKKSRIYDEDIIILNLISLYLSKSKGRNFIVSKLLQKGFDKEKILEKIGKFEDKDLNLKLKSFLEKKFDSLERKSKDIYDLRQRLTKAAMSRGFDYKEIKGVVDNLTKK